MPSICLVAGDPSGDAHAARLIEALHIRDASLIFTGLGGPAMQRAGARLLTDLTAAAAIGPFDAMRHLGALRRATRLLEEHVRAHRPDLAILVDFGDFNLPIIAPLVKRHGVPILYYISPQVWAWGSFRLRYIRRYVGRMAVLFKFEEAFYRRARIPVTWVGHPLVEATRPSISREEAQRRVGLNPWRRTVGLLPGSREREIARHLPLMLEVAARIAWRMPGVQFLLLKAPAVRREVLEQAVASADADVRLADGPAADALQLMDAACVASGTATLETALCGVPMVVVYKTSWSTYLAARVVIRVPHIAMVNVVAGRELVPEFVQHRATPKRIAQTMVELLRDAEHLKAIREGLQQVSAALGPPGAVGRAADVVFDVLKDAARD